jgi:DNA-binding GntR family transcriptional regulator
MSETFALHLPSGQRQNLGEHIADVLREAIFRRVFKPGQRLTEVAIASRLRVSRAPVREALAVLEQEGLVSRTANKGAMVPLLSAKDAREICSFRRALEVLAVRLAIPRMTEEHLTRLAESIRAQENAENAEQLTLLDLQFHEIVVRAADHARLLAAWWNLRSQIRLLLLQHNLTDAESPRGTVQAYKKFLEAIRRKDEVRAVELIERSARIMSSPFEDLVPRSRGGWGLDGESPRFRGPGFRRRAPSYAAAEGNDSGSPPLNANFDSFGYYRLLAIGVPAEDLHPSTQIPKSSNH